ncbi:hypothetical protein WR25_25932 [Diploscapter pachys]|uniref:Uncharacterized protein n=1 Tax=Diploscapter pachys TaxID=2018661 RepID=A0A2A2KSK8_9BILA|nr:hypothetical protein WR25_25932 [Diploscapter pachys]
MKLLDQVASLYNQELFEEIVFLYEFTNPKSAEITDLSVKNQILLQVYVADAYFESQQYKQSAKNFTQTEVRYRYYRTLMRIRHYAEALDVLREVPFQSAPTKIKYALLRLVTVHFGDDRGFDIQEMINNPQSAAFLELLFLQIRQGMTLSQKQQTDLTAKVNFLNNSNMKTWLTLHFEIMNRNHTEGIRQLLNLSPQGYRISLEMAEVYNLMGMKAECHDAIKCAHSSEQDRSERMGLYARVLRQTVTGDVRLNLRIDALASSLKRSDSDCADVWIAYGEFAAAKKDYSKAIHFACKAENMSPDIFTRSLSRQLKAGIFVTMNKFVDAEKILRSAIVEDPKNFQFYEMLVDAIINQKKKHSVTRALNVVDICMERLPDDPQAKTLNAMLKLKTKRRGTVS